MDMFSTLLLSYRYVVKVKADNTEPCDTPEHKPVSYSISQETKGHHNGSVFSCFL